MAIESADQRLTSNGQITYSHCIVGLSTDHRQTRLHKYYACNIQGGPNNCTPNSWPYFCQIVTDFQNSFIGRFYSRFAEKWSLWVPQQCCQSTLWNINARKQAISGDLQGNAATYLSCGGNVNNQIKKGFLQETQLSPSDRAMRLVSSNLGNCHATVQKLLIRQVLTKLMVWSWRFSRRQCVIYNVHSTMTRPNRLPLSQVS